LRVKHGCTYHGLALNVDMDLRPFAAINPCGYPGLAVTDCRTLGLALTVADAESALAGTLLRGMDG
jgi:lipoyl(octanoyl) transferase